MRVYNSAAEISMGHSIAQMYTNQVVNGWGGTDVAVEHFNLITSDAKQKFFVPFNLRITGNGKLMLYQATRKVLGSDTKNYPQQIGDCVSFGAKNASEHLVCTQIVLGNQSLKFRPVFPPYLYGCGRVFIGQGRIPANEDGSVGAWQAQAVQQYGVLAADEEGVPAYAGSVAKKWGGGNGPPKNFIDIAKHYPVKSATAVNSWEDAVAAVTNGYPVTIASDQGFTMQPGSDGFHSPKGQWGHQMCCSIHTSIKSSSSKEIEKICVGDSVLGHDGKMHRVTQVFIRDFDGELIQIKSHGVLPLEITGNHPIAVWSDDSNYEEIGKEDVIAIAVKRKTIKWINAEDIKPGDYLISPAYMQEHATAQIPEWIQSGKKKIKEPYKLELDDELAWFFGLYVTDGSAEPNHKICITLGIEQTDVITRCIKVIQDKLGLNPHVRYYEKFVRIKVFSAVLANSMLTWFNKKEKKRLPEWLFTGWNLKEVIQGIFDGDGNYIKNNVNCRRIVNTSATLIDQIHTILMTHGEKPSISKYQYTKDNQTNWQDRYHIEWYTNSNKKQFNYWSDNKLLIEVQDVSKSRYCGKVYNLEVEDCHSYIANGVAVHNCLIGVDNSYKIPYGIILNSWGDVMGHLKDFDNGEDLPVGVIRARAEVIEKMIKQQDSFAYSHMDWFPGQGDVLADALFMLV